MRTMNWLAAGALAMAMSGYAVAQTATVTLPADDVIAARQAGYDLQSANMVAMKAAVDQGADVKIYADTAKAISAWGHAIPTLFPDGTQTGHNTKALPAIWSDRAGFDKAASNLVAEADKLAVLAEADDKAGFASQFRATGQACGACHRTYRAKAS